MKPKDLNILNLLTKIAYFVEFPKILSGMEKDIDTYESLSASFAVRGYGVPRPSVQWYVSAEVSLFGRRCKKFNFSTSQNKKKVYIYEGCILKIEGAIDLKKCSFLINIAW